jgi:formyltetrahydrofolate-dependent phosphoribosylglycinamide formyltransferase
MAVRVAVLASGGGTNLQALLDALAPDAPARVTRVVSDRPDAGALARARRAGVAPVVLGDPADAAGLVAALGDAELVVLAGYLKLVPADVVARWRWRLVNIHPALLPAFGGPGMYGRRVHDAVLASGARVSGATVHYVDEAYDRGPIIAQWPVPMLAGDTADRLAQRVLAVEHLLLPGVVLALVGLGLPDRPVRLSARGEAFAVGPAGQLDVKLDPRPAFGEVVRERR